MQQPLAIRILQTMFSGLGDTDPVEVSRISLIPAMDRTPEENAILQSVNPTPVNSCDGCSVCCKFPAIEQLNAEANFPAKPAGKMCQHCTAPGHCSIYNARPSVCSGYFCTYALGFTKTKPTEYNLCWTFQSADGKDGKALGMAVAHCGDAMAALKDHRVLEDIGSFLETGLFHGASLRDSKVAILILPDFSGPGRVVGYAAPIDPTDPLHATVMENEAHKILTGTIVVVDSDETNG